MSRIQFLAVIACTVSALTPIDVCGDERPNPPLYANLASLICKSTDGGLTWTSHAKGGPVSGVFEVLDDGTFVLLRAEGEHPKTQVVAKMSKGRRKDFREVPKVHGSRDFPSPSK
jgi:hypothetical protein